jgi:hypothetical protein
MNMASEGRKRQDPGESYFWKMKIYQKWCKKIVITATFGTRSFKLQESE